MKKSKKDVNTVDNECEKEAERLNLVKDDGVSVRHLRRGDRITYAIEVA